MVEQSSNEQHDKNSMDNKNSELAKKEYWDSTFERDINTFEEFGDDGEVWFGKDVQKKTVEYILNQYCAKQNTEGQQ